MKVYCRPPHIVDVAAVFFCLYGTDVSIRRLYLPMTMILNGDDFSFMDSYDEVTPEEFAVLCEKHASKESLEKFTQEYHNTFKFPQ